MIVQPPPKVKQGIRMWPYPTPAVRMVMSKEEADRKKYIARAACYFDEEENEFNDFSGTANMVGTLMPDADAAGAWVWVFPFTKLSITRRGTFTIRFDILDQLEHETVFDGYIFTSYVTVSSQNQPVFQACKSLSIFWGNNELLTIILL